MTLPVRDNFTAETKRQLASSVGTLCSICSCETHGPNETFSGSISTGIAAHICAASPGGPRYDASMTKAERSSFKNGIWLCANHSILIDRNPADYPKELLLKFKHDAMQKQKEKLFNSVKYSPIEDRRDVGIVLKYADVLNYRYIRQLASEPFGARVSHNITDPLYEILDMEGDPAFRFNNKPLETLRTQLNEANRDFWNHFGKQSGGNIGFYDYINIDEIKSRYPGADETYWENYIYETHRLAMVIHEKAMLFLLKKEGFPIS